MASSLQWNSLHCEAVGMRINISKSEAVVLSPDKFLTQVEGFKYLWVLFTRDGRGEREIDRQIGAASAVMRTLYQSVVVKRQLGVKAKCLGASWCSGHVLLGGGSRPTQDMLERFCLSAGLGTP